MEDVVVPGMKMLHYRSNSDSFFLPINSWKKHGCILSIVATDALVLKHQAISVYSADWIFFSSGPFSYRNIAVTVNSIMNIIPFWKCCLDIKTENLLLGSPDVHLHGFY